MKIKSIRVPFIQTVMNMHTIGYKWILPILLVFFFSCNEEEFLKEEPLDFYAPENSYVMPEQFDAALVNLYYRYKYNFWGIDNGTRCPRIMWHGTDFIYNSASMGDNPNYTALLLPDNTSFVYNSVWKPAYKIIYDANVIIDRTTAEASELTDEEVVLVQAEAKFFRAWAYRMLANIYGGVPIVLEEIKSPKRDFVRATREEVYSQCAEDLEFAAVNLPDIGEVDESRVTRVAANHVLSEIYISLERWQDAINKATEVIDHPATGLMTERFGSMANLEVDTMKPWATGGDVFWDLFRSDNQGRAAGNTEGIWVIFYKYNVDGGGTEEYNLERFCIPRLWRTIVDNPDGSSSTIVPGPNTYYFGRGSGFLRPTHFFCEEIWTASGYDQDIRNSQYNIVRDVRMNNPSSHWDGQWIIKDNLPIHLTSATDTCRNFFPVVAKCSTVGQHPTELYDPNPVIPGTLTSRGRQTFRNHYAIRLAETYLLRAEAYLGASNTTLAATDINVVRSRAQAPPVDASEVDIDYILDERMRELHYEEFRVQTLTRLGKLVERTREHNPQIGATYSDHNNLWPIPYTEIEKNTEAELTQNPGY